MRVWKWKYIPIAIATAIAIVISVPVAVPHSRSIQSATPFLFGVTIGVVATVLFPILERGKGATKGERGGEGGDLSRATVLYPYQYPYTYPYICVYKMIAILSLIVSNRKLVTHIYKVITAQWHPRFLFGSICNSSSTSNIYFDPATGLHSNQPKTSRIGSQSPSFSSKAPIYCHLLLDAMFFSCKLYIWYCWDRWIVSQDIALESAENGTQRSVISYVCGKFLHLSWYTRYFIDFYYHSGICRWKYVSWFHEWRIEAWRHICASVNFVITVSGNGLVPIWWQTITWTDDDY